VLLCSFAFSSLSSLHGQSDAKQSLPQWQIDAGGSAKFDTASVKRSLEGVSAHSNFSFSDQGSPPSGGLFSATSIKLPNYILFAYKLTASQGTAMTQQLPPWTNSYRFDVQARADGNPSTDQMRLMMQSLLAERFKLKAHFETRQLPAFGVALEKAGRTGARLVVHSADPPCTSAPAPGSPPPADPTALPNFCGTPTCLTVSGQGGLHLRCAARDMTMDQIVQTLLAASGQDLDRPLSNQTGLSGRFDFSLEWTPQFRGPLPPGVQLDETGLTFVEALNAQLGLKLVPQTAPLNVLVIDHVEEPSPN
jgi:uncharacterized protein (TIGR03435 family)